MKGIQMEYEGKRKKQLNNRKSHIPKTEHLL